jgi:exonuclease III
MINKQRVFLTPPPLTVPPTNSFNGYLINTNGLGKTKVTTPMGNAKPALSKLQIALEKATDLKADVLQLVETHDTSTIMHNSSKKWWAEESTPTTNKHGTATLTKREPIKSWAAVNVSASKINWEGQEILILTVYFPNNTEETLAAVKQIDKILSKNKGKRVILGGDFNSTEGYSSFDTGGQLNPTHHREARAIIIEELLNKWRLKDWWLNPENPAREKERKDLLHLTHWNVNHSRGVRIDRIYGNFVVEGTVTINTVHHPCTDHKGLHVAITPKGDTLPKVNKIAPLPHRAFELLSIKTMIQEVLLAHLEEDQIVENTFSKWDKAKRTIRKRAIHLWQEHVRENGRINPRATTATSSGRSPTPQNGASPPLQILQSTALSKYH